MSNSKRKNGEREIEKKNPNTSASETSEKNPHGSDWDDV